MAKGYWVASVDVSDPEGYKLYVAEKRNAFQKYGARFVTRAVSPKLPKAKDDHAL